MLLMELVTENYRGTYCKAPIALGVRSYMANDCGAAGNFTGDCDCSADCDCDCDYEDCDCD